MSLVPIGTNERHVFDAKCEVIEGRRGLRIKSELKFDEWQQLLESFTKLEGVIQFIIGDLLAYGMAKFERGKYEQALIATGRAKQTLANWSSVSRAFPPETRQHDVPYSHYQDLATVKDADVRIQLLRSADSYRWTTKKLRSERDKATTSKKDRDRYGKPIKVDGLAHAPINEQGVVFLFGLLSKQLGFSVDAVQQSFPDCIAKRKIPGGRRSEEWGVVRIEFEFLSSEFRRHGHDASRCNLIVCWKHDWQECPIEVLSLEGWIDKNL